MITWLAICTFLVLLMQAGFTCFEAGLVRPKNSINVAIKNVADLGISVLLFMLIGYRLMFGEAVPGLGGLIGWGVAPLTSDNPQLMLQALFQAMFAGTAITIVSGAVSERTSFRGYLALAAVMSVFVYPVSGHWAWGNGGWLSSLGFYDFAGGTVVHTAGGAIALAAVLCIGPRLGRFDTEAGIEPFNLSVAALGAFLLMFGWFGFNSGASMSLEAEIPLVLVNTAIGGTVGIVVSLVADIFRGAKHGAQSLLTSMLGGLVGVTAGCAAIPPSGAAALGAMGGLSATYGVRLLDRLKIDDPVDAIPVHLFAGLVGTVFIPVFAYESAIPDAVSGRLEWFLIQVLGSLGIGGFAFVAAFLFIRLSNRVIHYRVPPDAERIGLNISEHDAKSGMMDLLNQMAVQGKSGNFSAPVLAEPETDAAYVANFYNGVRERFLVESAKSQKLLDEAQHLAHHDPLTGIANRRAFSDAAQRKLAEVKRTQSTAAIISLDIDYFKSVNDTHGHDIGDAVLCELARRITESARAQDVVARMGGEEFAILISQHDPEEAVRAAERFREAIANLPFQTSAGALEITASFGVSSMTAEASLDDTLKACDQALYRAKEAGRNCVMS